MLSHYESRLPRAGKRWRIVRTRCTSPYPRWARRLPMLLRLWGSALLGRPFLALCPSRAYFPGRGLPRGPFPCLGPQKGRFRHPVASTSFSIVRCLRPGKARM
jgi:hypothetical protein